MIFLFCLLCSVVSAISISGGMIEITEPQRLGVKQAVRLFSLNRPCAQVVYWLWISRQRMLPYLPVIEVPFCLSVAQLLRYHVS